ncbi:MAG: glycosyltransferase [Paludibacter sp.]|nr:glycosyltransferase [Paludibacter sp.]
MTLLYITLISTLIYIGLIVVFNAGWKRIAYFDSKATNITTFKISVVIACRNEVKNLPNLFSALQLQTYHNFELIIVNDHSTDGTQAMIESNFAFFKNISVIQSKKYGKKNAIAEGIHKACGELIITTDADCVPAPAWIETIVNFYGNSKADMIICPVKITENKSLFSKLQALEFTSLIASGAGAAGAGMPIMCNAANLAFTKKAWLESQKDLHYEEHSGDDIFLLLSIKKRKGKILFLKTQNALVYTQPSLSLKAFFKQRRRWAGKSKFYTDWQIIIVASIVFGISILQVFFLFLSFFYIHFFPQYLIILVAKFVTDCLFLNYVNSFFHLKHVFKNSLIISLIYPFYTITAFFGTFFPGKSAWK